MGLLALEFPVWRERDVLCPCSRSQGQKTIQLTASLAQTHAHTETLSLSKFFWLQGRQVHLFRPLLFGVFYHSQPNLVLYATGHLGKQTWGCTPFSHFVVIMHTWVHTPTHSSHHRLEGTFLCRAHTTHSLLPP